MQITFFDADSDELTSQRKGHLFESFAKRLVELCGYRDITLRVKRASLEYDIEATSVIGKRPLSGEAKAHESAISGKELSAFVGKVMPLAVARNGLDGLFISTSRLTPEGQDYLGTLTPDVLDAMKMTLTTLIGEGIIDFLVENGRCIKESQLRAYVKAETDLEPHDAWLVIGSRGDTLIVSVGASPIGAPTSFITFNLGGKRTIETAEDVRRLQLQMSDLQSLVYLDGFDSGAVVSAGPETLPGVIAGAGWFDYKFPSPPDCFIGRTDALATIVRHLEAVSHRTSAVRALQILSRSGVGKSSLLLKVAETAAYHSLSVTVDGRNLLSPSDLRLVVASLVSQVNQVLKTGVPVPNRQDDAETALVTAGGVLNTSSAVATVQVDQFEALLSRPSVYRSLLDLVAMTTERSLPLVWVMARKNDLAATYDDGAEIDLTRLNDLSRAVMLDDFSTMEEQELLGRLSTELGRGVTKPLSEAILTFSAGFPWLLKRVCAHVLQMSRLGVNQNELARGGLRAEDLFNEDLAGLDESDKALLSTLAANLPNTAAELSRRLEGEVGFQRLTESLNAFLGRKLLRLSGNVYDTYNDVFKSYLLTERVPFQTRYVFRVTPGAALGLITAISEEGSLDAATLTRRVGGSQTATYNKLRELRLLGIVDPQPGRVALSAAASAAIEADQLGNFLRKALRANALVSRALDLVASNERTELAGVTQLLRRELPHVDASDATWTSYASILINWLRYAGMVDVEGDVVRRREAASDDLVLRREFSRGNFATGTFVPSVRPGKIRDLIEIARGGPVPREVIHARFGNKFTAAVIRDARALNVVEENGFELRLSPHGRALVAENDVLSDRTIAVLALSKPNVDALLQAAAVKPVATAEQREILERFGSANWTPKTWTWRLGILGAWVVATGQARGGRAGLRAVAT
jgi:hypothetical protein